MSEANRPFRWDLVRPDQLGTLLDGVPTPDLPFLDQLTQCAAKVLARSGGGEIHFVGRSLDSVFDLLSGALDGTSWLGRIHQLPLSTAFAHWGRLGDHEVRQLRTNLDDAGISPAAMAGRTQPTVLADLVSSGSTFALLYRWLREWIDDERVAWNVIRRKLRFLGVTCEYKTSPNTRRWQQVHADWTVELPASAIQNVSLEPGPWSYLADRQHKLSPTFSRWYWADENVRAPRHDERTRKALAEAIALVEAGRRRDTRESLVRHLTAEPAIRERWLRSLVTELRSTPHCPL
ncbi:hypothetical protein [Amycolatopsis sp. NPDC058986]|uniref:hypothetical protein n=1 Tax=unclassified Amycolatopsis TaxID=2618356 RepID=UPI003671039D